MTDKSFTAVELDARRNELGVDIWKLVEKFQLETGFEVSELYMEQCEVTNIEDDQKRMRVTRVIVEIDLP